MPADSDPKVQHVYELRTAVGTTITWPGVDEADAARRAEDCLGIPIIATRPVRHGIFTLGAGRFIP